MTTYNKDFYDSYRVASHLSASLYLGEIFKAVQPRSLLDVGCGVGTWLRAAKELGIADVYGVDGDYVKPDQLEIEHHLFKPHDLTKSLDLGRKFDIAISMEVGEHLPEAFSDKLVDSLTKHADIILFSAAIPHQGGTDHINEQWPDFWASKFESRGYVAIDFTRPRLWNEDRIDYYYIQNGFLYVKPDILNKIPGLSQCQIPSTNWSMRAVHPVKWAGANNPKFATLRFAGPAFFNALPKAIGRRLGRLFGKGF